MDYKGISIEVTRNVYPPAEDSFMLADAARKAGSVLEIGCGSGIVSLAWAMAGNEVLGVDINPEAVSCARENAKRNSISAKFIESDLFSNVGGMYDAILFNPPYLPTDDSEKLEGNINHAFDGGQDGRLVLERFLNGLKSHLKKDGELFLIQSSLNNLESTKSELMEMGFSIELEKKDFFFEKLYLIRGMMT